ARLQSFQQVESRNGAARSMRFFSLSGDDQSRAAGFFYHARGDDADYAAVPSIAIEDHTELFCQLRFLSEPRFDFRNDACFLVLPLGIEQVEFFCNLTATLRNFTGKQLNDITRHVHASGGIDSRAETKAYIAGSEGTPTVRQP